MGYLPPGEHDADWPEFLDRFGWNLRRRWLIGGLRRMALNLRSAGCAALFVDGSFVTDHPHPGDFDACCDYTGMDPIMIDLRLLGPRDVMKAAYLGEVFPERRLADGALTFREFFQSDRDGRCKGIIRLELGSVR